MGMNSAFLFIKHLIFILPMTSMLVVNTMQETKSRTYGMMLKTLLSHTVPEISVPEAADLHHAIWLDARGTEEYEVSHIAKAQWVGYESFSIDAVSAIPKASPIVVYCSVGYRSEKIAEKLIADGYTEVYNLYGGIFEWKNQGNALVDSENISTEKVHAYNRMWGVWLHKGEKVYH